MADINPSAADYNHRQAAHVTRILSLLGVGLGVLLLALTADDPSYTWVPVGYLAIAIGALVHLVLFWSMTVRVTDQVLEFWLGPGLVRRRIPLEQITDLETVRTRIRDGWGIRRTMLGRLYNVSGFRAVRVRLKTGKSILIGTNQPRALARAIRERLPSAPAASAAPESPDD
ncbi:MAG: hypothetical protein R6X20_12475 [Phycisphaerae bacterium]